jgi:hypothetical protein
LHRSKKLPSGEIQKDSLTLTGMIIKSIRDVMVVNNGMGVQKIGMTASISSNPNSVSSFDLYETQMRANDMEVRPEDSRQIYFGMIQDNPLIVLEPAHANGGYKFIQVYMQGLYYIGVEHLRDTVDRQMYLFKCNKFISLKETDTSKTDVSFGFKPSLNCILVQKIPVNNKVNLVDAIILNDYLIVRFKSENSVVYYKVDVYEYSSVEINLKGYDPTMAWLAQLKPNTILLCHFKKTSLRPFTLFSLEGETMTKLQEPNIDKFKTSNSMGFKAGSLIEEEERVYLYLALSSKYSTQSQIISISKFDLTNASPNIAPEQVRTAHDIFGGTELETALLEMCFLPDRLVVLAQIPIQPSQRRNPQEDTQSSIYLIDLNNPNLDYKYPLDQFGIFALKEAKLVCKTEEEIVILQGVTEEYEEDNESSNRKTINIFLNGQFANANNRIFKIAEVLEGDDCRFSYPTNYIVEMCINRDKAGVISMKNRFYNVTNPKIYAKVPRTDDSSHSTKLFFHGQSASNWIYINFTVSGPEYPLKINVWDEFIREMNSSATGHAPLCQTYNLMDVFPDYKSGKEHFLRAKVLKKHEKGSGKHSLDYVPTNSSSFSISILERLNKVKTYPKLQDIEASSDTWNGQYPGFDRFCLKGDVFATVSIIMRSWNLESWVSFYWFDRNTANLTFIKKYTILSICNEFEFEIFNLSGESTSMYAALSIACNQGPRYILRVYTLNLLDTSTELNQISPENPDFHYSSQVWTVQVEAFTKATKFYIPEGSAKIAILASTEFKSSIYLFNVTSSSSPNDPEEKKVISIYEQFMNMKESKLLLMPSHWRCLNVHRQRYSSRLLS